MLRHIIRALIWAFIGLGIYAQVDETGYALVWDFHGLAALAVLCAMMFVVELMLFLHGLIRP